jgi:methylated-DNA-[protein]-cysteine S-methyltransferase
MKDGAARLDQVDRRLKRAGRALSGPSVDATARFLAAAGDLVDVAYAKVDSPLGEWLLAVTPRGLVRVAFTMEFDDVLDELSEKISPRVLEAPARLDDLRREFDEYFEGKRQDFDVPLDWSLAKGFNLKVLRATAKIPFGSVSTYKDMATRAGSPRAARAAGNALHNNPIPLVVPCHRVLHSDGGLGGYGGGLPMKEFLLKLEGALDE